MARRLLCTNDEERGRVLDMNRRLRPVALASSAMLLAGGAATIPTFGWAWLIPDTLGAAAYYFLTRRLNHFRRPELALVGMWLLAELLLATGVALAHSPREYLLSMLVFPVVLGSIMFPRRVVVPCVGFTLLVVLALGTGFDWRDVRATPPTLLVPVVAVIVLAMTGSALGSLDARSRSTAVVDALTGAFNRMALVPRIAEVAHQANATGNPVSVIVCDVDAFKAINDRLGHSAGDAVLKEVVARLASCLGAFEPIYRFGGEEFVIMLPGAEHTQAMQAAERLRQAVAATPILGLTVTVSIGVAASDPHRSFDFEAVFSRADRALYNAKHSGRNRVSIDATGSALSVERPRRERRRLGLRGEGQAEMIQLARPAPADRWRDHVERERRATGNWLVRDRVEREHMLDLNRLLGRNFRRSAAVTFAGIILSVPWFGPLLLVPPIVAGTLYNLIQMRLDRLRRPEFALVGGWLMMQLGIAGGFMLAHHAPLFALPLFLLMVIGSAAVFPQRAVVVGVATTALLLVVVAMRLGAHEVQTTPAILVLPLVLLGIIALTGSAVGRSSIHYRSAAVVDDLTGLLNRAALAARAAELAHQTRLTGEGVAVILVDLDHFKSINDGHGHARGDIVLREVAYRIRKHLRAFEPVYRLGGEEFAVLLAGCSRDEATGVADRIRDAVHVEPVDGLGLTMSCGVAATEPGEVFDFDTMFARADAALYAAKRSGRNCIRIAASPLEQLAA